MELWIRDQDRERLTICRDLRMGELSDNGKWYIEDCDWLGTYETKERALEILDEIESIIIAKEIYANDREAFEESCQNYTKNSIQEFLKQMFVYEMPKE